MHQTQRRLIFATLVCAVVSGQCVAQTSAADRDDVLGGEVTFDTRLRYEHVRDEVADDADAMTLRSAVTWQNDAVFGNRQWAATVELENIVALTSADYSDGESDRATALIADPAGTELNQIAIAYRAAQGWQATLGRQPLSFGDERFVGTVAFRQNHQSFDALSWHYDDDESWALTYAYVVNVNRIFGDAANGPNAGLLGDHQQNTHLLNALFKGWSFGELESYAYLIENKDFQRASTDTYGMRFSGSVRPGRLTYLYTLEAARQTSRASNPQDYAAAFVRASGGVSYKRLSVQLTQERLGRDNNAGFVTPFATLHRFQGWADKFVAQTPDQGLINNFITIAGRWPGFRYRLQYHDFDADAGGQDIGREVGLHLQYRFRQNVMMELKLADYRADSSAPSIRGVDADTRRVFVSVSGKFGG